MFGLTINRNYPKMSFKFLSTFAPKYYVYCKIIIIQAELKLVIQKQLTCAIVYI